MRLAVATTKTAPVFVVATANRVDALPPELLRKGRFDEIFFIDLPAASERREIFRIPIQRPPRGPPRFHLGGVPSPAPGGNRSGDAQGGNTRGLLRLRG